MPKTAADTANVTTYATRVEAFEKARAFRVAQVTYLLWIFQHRMTLANQDGVVRVLLPRPSVERDQELMWDASLMRNHSKGSGVNCARPAPRKIL